MSEQARPSVVNARQRLEVVEFECPRTVAEPIVYHRSLRVVNRFAVMVFDRGGGQPPSICVVVVARGGDEEIRRGRGREWREIRGMQRWKWEYEKKQKDGDMKG